MLNKYLTTAEIESTVLFVDDLLLNFRTYILSPRDARKPYVGFGCPLKAVDTVLWGIIDKSLFLPQMKCIRALFFSLLVSLFL